MKSILIGTIVNTHGLRGDLKILSNSDFKKYRFKIGGKIDIIDNDKNEFTFTVKKYKDCNKYDILGLKEITSIEEALKYKNCNLYVSKDIENEILLDKNEYHYKDILNCNVYNQDKIYIGVVYKINKLVFYDLWYIKRNNNKDLIIPFKDFFVKEIDVKNKKVIVNLLKGM